MKTALIIFAVIIVYALAVLIDTALITIYTVKRGERMDEDYDAFIALFWPFTFIFQLIELVRNGIEDLLKSDE